MRIFDIKQEKRALFPNFVHPIHYSALVQVIL